MSKIDKYRDKLRAIDRNIDRKAQDVKTVIERFHLKEVAAIPWNDMLKFPENKIIPFNDKIRIIREKSDSDRIDFRSWFDRGGEVGLHKHPDFDELFIILTGVVYEVVSDMTYNEGEQFFIAAGQEHKIVGLEDSEFLTIAQR